MRKIAIAALALVAMAGCAKEDSYTPTESSDIVKFSSAAIDTRVSADGAYWDTVDNEYIGITMYSVDTDDGNAESLSTSNVKYVSDNTAADGASTDFVADGATSLLYPNVGSVKFYAYYPYTDAIESGYKYTANVSDQSQNIDFMVAKSGIVTRTTTNNPLAFTHQLAKITFVISGNDNVTDLSKVTAVSVVGLNTTGVYDIRTGVLATGELLSGSDATINFVMGSYNSTDNTISATAIVHPETLDDAATVTFTLTESTVRTFTISLPVAFDVSKNHIYSVALGNDLPIFTGSTITGWSDEVEGSLYSTEVTQ